MVNFMAFFSKFCSYLLLMAIIVVIAMVGGFVGYKLRQSKNRKAEAAVAEGSDEN